MLHGKSYGGLSPLQVGVGIPLGLTVAAVGLAVAVPVVGLKKGRRRWRRRREARVGIAAAQQWQREQRGMSDSRSSVQFDGHFVDIELEARMEREIAERVEHIQTRIQSNVPAALGDQIPLPRQYALGQMDQSPVHPEWARELAAIEASLGAKLAAIKDPVPAGAGDRRGDHGYMLSDTFFADLDGRSEDEPEGEATREGGPSSPSLHGGVDWDTISPLVRSSAPPEARASVCHHTPA